MGWGIAELAIMIDTVAVYAYCDDAFPKHQVFKTVLNFPAPKSKSNGIFCARTLGGTRSNQTLFYAQDSALKMVPSRHSVSKQRKSRKNLGIYTIRIATMESTSLASECFLRLDID